MSSAKPCGKGLRQNEGSAKRSHSVTDAGKKESWERESIGHIMHHPHCLACSVGHYSCRGENFICSLIFFVRVFRICFVDNAVPTLVEKHFSHEGGGLCLVKKIK